MNDDDEATAKAVAAIEETLQGFSSPMVGDLSRRHPQQQQQYPQEQQQYPQEQQQSADNYTMDAMEWMQHELKGTNNEREAALLPPPKQTPRRTPLMERAGTPVMSNSSKNANNKSGSKSYSSSMEIIQSSENNDDSDSDSDDDDDSGEDVTPRPVQTPLQRRFKTASNTTTPNPKIHHPTGGGSSVTAAAAAVASSSSSSSNASSSNAASLKKSVFRRHHDALWDYLVAKRSLENRMSLERRERELENNAKEDTDAMVTDETPYNTNTNTRSNNNNNNNAVSESLSKQECKTEVDFCKNLCQIGYGLTYNYNHPEGPMEEGHFWDLLATLRKLSLPALIWDDDSTSRTQNSSSQAFFLQQLSATTNATPKELVAAMTTSNNSSSSSSSSGVQSPSTLPLVLERKQVLLKWIQSCLELESKDIKAGLPSSKTNPVVLSPGHPDDPNLPSLLSETDSNLLKTTTQVCLALFLEGKNSQALEILRSFGQFGKAAMWKGGEPFGYSTTIRDDTQTVEQNEVGNPNRFLWKRQVWKTGRKLLLQHSNISNSNISSNSSNSSSQQQHQLHQSSVVGTPYALEEAAICSILSDDVQNALENPCIRSSWTRSLCVLLTGVRGRSQDEVLHKNNSYKRRSGVCFAGQPYEQQENEQLMVTKQLSAMTEAQMAAKLSESLFLQQDSTYKSAIMAFVVGRSAILEFCATETAKMVSRLQQVRKKHVGDGNNNNQNHDEYIHQDWEGVRFVTHLTLFLDSLQGSSTPMVCDTITDQKNAILFEYVQYLESRPDLWHMIALYVGLLPEHTVLEYFPTVLVQVLDDAERTIMNGQIRDLMPALELPLLRRVVRLSLSASSASRSGRTSTSRSEEREKEMDVIKCNSLQWLLHKDEHLEDALICANILLREFFLNEKEDKTGVAMTFLNDYLPEDFLDLVEIAVSSSRPESSGSISSNNSNNDVSEDWVAKVNNAATEHRAYIAYLEAYSTFQTWREVLEATPTSSVDDDHHYPQLPNSNLNETEQSIADSNRLRTWVKEKKKHLETTLTAAEDARMAWHRVLTHPGGWLSVEGDGDHNTDAMKTILAAQQFDSTATYEEQQRRVDISAIRSRHLVLAANLYHQVCEETAAWLSKSLHEAEDFSLSRDEVLHKLGSNHHRSSADYSSTEGVQQQNRNQTHTPEYWYQHSLGLATLVASDKHAIRTAFPPSDLMELITKLAETGVSKLMNV